MIGRPDEKLLQKKEKAGKNSVSTA